MCRLGAVGYMWSGLGPGAVAPLRQGRHYGWGWPNYYYTTQDSIIIIRNIIIVIIPFLSWTVKI